jgi:hypothetical protein
MTTSPTVDITAAVPAAVRIPMADLRATDRVFDTHGGTHGLLWVRHYKRTVRFRRDDAPPGWVESRSTDDGATTTVLRAEA